MATNNAEPFTLGAEELSVLFNWSLSFVLGWTVPIFFNYRLSLICKAILICFSPTDQDGSLVRTTLLFVLYFTIQTLPRLYSLSSEYGIFFALPLQ